MAETPTSIDHVQEQLRSAGYLADTATGTVVHLAATLSKPVLIEGPHPESDLLLAGRLPAQAPEVDGCVIITDGNGQAGEIRPVRITASHDSDVEGAIL